MLSETKHLVWGGGGGVVGWWGIGVKGRGGKGRADQRKTLKKYQVATENLTEKICTKVILEI